LIGIAVPKNGVYVLSLETRRVPCHPCLSGKQTRSRSTKPQTRAEKPFDLVHMDLGGYYVPSPAGHRYFLGFVDDATRYTWAWLLKTKDKSATSKAIREFLAFVKNQFGVEIKRARTDNGTGEFTNSEWDDIVAEIGIQHETSPLIIKIGMGSLNE
jgi:transposase InsO family protein